QIEFLGHIVSATTVQPTPDKVQAILDIPPPRTLSQANKFLGKIGYYRKFIHDFAAIAAPLHKVTNKTRTKRHEFYWHAEQQAAFEQFKTILTTAPLFLHYPDPSLPFVLSTDCSLTRIAGVLKQKSSTGEKICYYKSRLLSDIERRYSTTEREALAIYWCLDQLRSCIGTSSIIIETDHQSLTNMHKNDDIVYRVTSKSTRIPYLPKSLIPTVLHFYHDHPLSGHFGVHRTLSRIRDKFWWPTMRKSIANYIASCPKCAQYNILRSKPPGHLKSIEPPSAGFQVLHMDFWGPIRIPSAHDNKYVIVLTDNLSKYVIAEAVPNCTAACAARFFIDRFILVHGAPERLITDQGSHFNNNLLCTITNVMNTPHNFSASYHPQTNGQVERFNATFAAQLAKYCNSEKTDWDLYLPSIVYAYNTSVHSTTKFTPYELAFARKPMSPFDLASPIVDLPPLHSFYPYLQRVRDLLTKQARTNILHHQTHWKKRYDQYRSDPSYQVDDPVYVHVPTGRSKLDARRLGPCIIVDTSGQQHYLVKNNLTGLTNWYHVNQLHPVVKRLLH
ncbi:unnamed protein product, partial [Rotaria sp. Silwood1]